MRPVAATGGENGCDWTVGGLLDLAPVRVQHPETRALCPVFIFDHQDSTAELGKRPLAAPSHFVTDAKTWAEFAWPEWVPEEVRTEIERFWSADWHRSPVEGATSARQNRAPVFGERVKMRDFGSNGRPHVEGRFVFAWNNIGRVVRDDATIAYVSF